MATNVTSVEFDEGVTITVHSGNGSYEAEEIEFRGDGVLVRFVQLHSTTETRHYTKMIPWSNVLEISQYTASTP